MLPLPVPAPISERTSAPVRYSTCPEPLMTKNLSRSEPALATESNLRVPSTSRAPVRTSAVPERVNSLSAPASAVVPNTNSSADSSQIIATLVAVPRSTNRPASSDGVPVNPWLRTNRLSSTRTSSARVTM